MSKFDIFNTSVIENLKRIFNPLICQQDHLNQHGYIAFKDRMFMSYQIVSICFLQTILIDQLLIAKSALRRPRI